MKNKTKAFKTLLCKVGASPVFLEAWGDENDFRLRVDFTSEDEWKKAKVYLLAKRATGGVRVVLESVTPKRGYFAILRYWTETCKMCNGTGKYVGWSHEHMQIRECSCFCAASVPVARD